MGEAAWRLRKAAALVKLLALAPAHALHREQITESLWPGADKDASSNNLRQALHAAREALHPDPAVSARLLASSGERVVLCPRDRLRGGNLRGGNLREGLWVDTEAFEEAAGGARRTREPSAYEAAIGLYAGELLPEDRYEEWAEGPRARLRGTYLSLLYELASLHEGRGDLGSAEGALSKLLAEEPTSEGAHTSLMRLYALRGRRSEALSQYERLEDVLSRYLGAGPAAPVRALREEISSGRYPPPDALGGALRDPGPREEGSLRHNIPTPRTSFVGREREILEVKRELASTRLLTLTGVGGSGKTRLSAEVGRDLAGAYPDGVWMAELAPLSREELVGQEVAGVLGVREQPGQTPEEALVRYLHDKETLLLLDNCEHLTIACARLSNLLISSCPRLKILATSREPLGVEGEVVWLVPSLAVPQISPPTGELAGYAAVRLFVERARLKLPAFALTEGNAEAVSEVCRRLEGVPLAVELAAARMGAMAVEQVARRLGDSLGLLTGGPRSASPRQRTMRATLEWSYGLLSEKERAAFRRLSVFAGGFTLEAAEAVLPGEGIASAEVLELVSVLVEKSLLVAEILPSPETRRFGAGDSGGPRYRFLEPIRQYAREKLKESGEAGETQARHAGFFAALAEEAEPELARARQLAWLGRLKAEHGNLRMALSWALDGPHTPERAEVGLRTATALARFWAVSGLGEGRGWLEKGLARSGPISPSVRARALNEAGWIGLFQGDARAIALLEESLALYKELADKSGFTTALANLGFALAHAGDRERVAALREEAEALRKEPLDRRALAHLLHFLGLAALEARDYEQAIALPEEALSLCRELEDTNGIVISLTSLGLTTLEAGDAQRAKGYFEENLNLLRDTGHKFAIAYCLLGLAGVAGEQLRPDRAARLWGAAEALRENIGMNLSPFDRSHYGYEERVAAARTLVDEDAWEPSWAAGRAMTPEEGIQYALSEEEASFPAAPGRPQGERRAAALTRREREVADLLAGGLTNRRIAEELHISERTVATHIGRIFKKLGARTRDEVAGRIAGDI